MVALLNCPECSYTTPEPAELRIHVEQEHPGERFVAFIIRIIPPFWSGHICVTSSRTKSLGRYLL